MRLIDVVTLDHLIPAETRERIEAERAAWEAKAERSRLEYEQFLAGEPDEEPENPVWAFDIPFDEKQLSWNYVAQVLGEHHENSPGDWVRIRRNVRTRSAEREVNAGRIRALESMNVEAFARRAKPRSDGLESGWEVYVRVAPTPE